MIHVHVFAIMCANNQREREIRFPNFQIPIAINIQMQTKADFQLLLGTF